MESGPPNNPPIGEADPGFQLAHSKSRRGRRKPGPEASGPTNQDLPKTGISGSGNQRKTTQATQPQARTQIQTQRTNAGGAVTTPKNKPAKKKPTKSKAQAQTPTTPQPEPVRGQVSSPAVVGKSATPLPKTKGSKQVQRKGEPRPEPAVSGGESISSAIADIEKALLQSTISGKPKEGSSSATSSPKDKDMERSPKSEEITYVKDEDEGQVGEEKTTQFVSGATALNMVMEEANEIAEWEKTRDSKNLKKQHGTAGKPVQLITNRAMITRIPNKISIFHFKFEDDEGKQSQDKLNLGQFLDIQNEPLAYDGSKIVVQYGLTSISGTAKSVHEDAYVLSKLKEPLEKYKNRFKFEIR